MRGVVVAAMVAAAVLVMSGPALAHTTAKQAHHHKRHHVVAPAKKGVKAHTSIAGGYTPQTTSWPWVSFLQAGDGMHGGSCTGTLIAPQRILTAAHCVGETLSANGLVINTGASAWTVWVDRRNTTTLPGEERHVTAEVYNPNFTGANPDDVGNSDYDVAILFLDKPVTDIAPAPIGTESDWGTEYASTGCGVNGDQACAEAYAMGWGHYNYDHANPVYPAWLQAGAFTLGSDDWCKSLVDGPNRYDSTTQLCAFDTSGNTCITHGDSGGPMAVYSHNEWVQIGVTSHYPSPQLHWGYCLGGTNVIAETWVAGPTIRNWIAAQTNPACPGARTNASGWQTRVTNDQGAAQANQGREPSAHTAAVKANNALGAARRHLRWVRRHVHRHRARALRIANRRVHVAYGSAVRAGNYYNGLVTNVTNEWNDWRYASAELTRANAWVTETCNS